MLGEVLVGSVVGCLVGASVGGSVGVAVGKGVGSKEGVCVGGRVGGFVGLGAQRHWPLLYWQTLAASMHEQVPYWKRHVPTSEGEGVGENVG